MTVHLLGLPHTETTRAFEFCAYTSKVRRFGSMLSALGERVVLYAGEETESDVAELVTIATGADRERWFGPWDTTRQVFNRFDPSEPGWVEWNARARAAIASRLEPRDIVAVSMGDSQRPAVDGLAPDHLTVETGVGYAGVWAPFRVYESAAWRAFLAARAPADDARFYDEVIPNFYDAGDFPAGDGRGGYVLFLGRMIRRKGVEVAAAAARRAGVPIVFAGQGVASVEPGRIVCDDGSVLEGDVRYAGLVGPAERARLMGGAIAILTPTLYFEPFGGVSVEAQFTGTPAIVTDWGGLPENVVAGETGFVCRTLDDFARAIANAPYLDRPRIRHDAIARWSTIAVGPRFIRYFRRLESLYGEGWYA